MRVNRILAMLLAFAMIAGMCPLSVFAEDGPVVELGVSQSFDGLSNGVVYASVTVDAGGYYAVHMNLLELGLELIDSDGNYCDCYYSDMDDSGGGYKYFYLPEAGTYRIRIDSWGLDLTLTMLMKPCEQPTELHLMERLYGTVGYDTWLTVSFGSPWEFASCTWSCSNDVISCDAYDTGCTVGFLQTGTAELTVETTGADGTLLSQTCAVTVCEKDVLALGKTVTRTVSPEQPLFFSFTPADTGYYCVPGEEYVFFYMWDVLTEEYAPSIMDNGDCFFFLEGGREYEVTAYNDTQNEQTIPVCPVAPAELPLGQETQLSFSGDQKLLTFTPEESGAYCLRTPDQMHLCVYDNNLEMLMLNTVWDEDTVSETAYLEAGKPYLINVGSYDDVYTGTILLDHAPALESISLEKQSGAATIFVGLEDTYVVRPNPANAADTYTWSIADESVAVITGAGNDYCWVQGVSVGTTTLTCRSAGGLTASVEVTVAEIEKYTVTLDQPLTLEMEYGETVSVSYTVPEDGYYVFYCNCADLDTSYVWHQAERYVDGIQAYYLYVDAGDTIENKLTDYSETPVVRTITLAKTRLPEQLSMTADDYYVFKGDTIDLTPYFESILDFDLVTDYTIENEDLLQVQSCWGNYLNVEAMQTGTTKVTLETESGMSASCMVHVVEPCGGTLTLGQPADVRYVEESFVTYTFTPEESGDYIVRADPEEDAEIYLEAMSEDYEDFAWDIFNPGTEPVLPVTLRGGVSYYIGTLAYENDYMEGTIVVEKADGTPAPVEIASGWSGSTTWVLTDDGVLTFSGEGNMKNYGYGGGQTWAAYTDQITAVVIEEGITSVGSGAFMNHTNLENVSLPETLTKMGEAAFYGTGLTSVEIPASLWTIQPYTFKNCANLTSVTFNEGNLQKISDGAFYGTGLTELVLPDCLDILDVYAFKGCADLTEISIGSGLTELREAVFYGTAIPTIEIPEGITKIGPYAFKNCVKLETVDFPSTLTSVGEASFYADAALKTVELPDAVTTIGNYAFRKCAAIETLTFGTELTSIGECAFYGCTGLTEIVIPNKVTTIKPYAFKTCTGLTSVTLGSKVATIGEGAFNTCTGLKTIVFPASLTSIGDYCFSGSYNLWKLTFQGDAPSIGTGAFKGMSAIAYYPGDNTTWTSAIMQNYGGKITWKAN